jgi:hypothetical protein
VNFGIAETGTILSWKTKEYPAHDEFASCAHRRDGNEKSCRVSLTGYLSKTPAEIGTGQRLTTYQSFITGTRLILILKGRRSYTL